MLDTDSRLGQLVTPRRGLHPRQMISGAQIRAARALLWLTPAELAVRAGVSVRTVHNAEREPGTPAVQVRTLERILAALREAGIVFIDANHSGGPGVRLRRS
jgi:DNA-binding transcriptional regulator YiaG